ncbi:MAG TPA: sulfotransferase [Pseudomonadales bacterium]|nr:sulfotransferase [Pseudomonadales bacterium]
MATSRIATDIPRPFLVRAIKGIGKTCQALGFELVKLDEKKLIDAAKYKTGLSDFGDDSFREGLQVLLHSLNTEANLNPMGQVIAYDMIFKLLSGRLQIIDQIKKHPDILQQEIRKPLVIAGLPRTGTTILQSLLCEDPAARFLYTWEALQPCPPVKGRDNRSENVEQQLAMMLKFVPGFAAIHPLGAMLPQECLALMAFNFVSVQFELNFHVPSYQAWYWKQDLVPTLQFHKQCLQWFQYVNPKQHWVLKTPPYLSAMEPLLAVYPDACIIQTHRDPARVMVSVSSLYYAIHALGCDVETPQRVGKLQTENWARHLAAGIQTRKKMADNPARFIDVYFEELLDNPVACVEKIYRHFGMPWKDALEMRMDAFMLQNGREKHGRHDYTAAMFGLDEQELDKTFREYREYFGIQKSQR